MHGIARDLRSALRQLTASLGLSLAIVLTLGLGIGANVAPFGIVEALELRPLPLGDPARLVAIGLRPRSRADQLPGSLSVPDAEEIARSAPHLRLRRRVPRGDLPRSHGSGATKVNLLPASAGLFRTLGLPLQLGRELSPSEVGRSPGSVAVVIDRFWRHALGGSAAVLGTTWTSSGAHQTRGDSVSDLPAQHLEQVTAKLLSKNAVSSEHEDQHQFL